MGRWRFACPGAHHPSQKSARCPLTDPANWLGWDRRAPAAPGACSELRHVGALREETTHGSKGRHQKTAVLERSHRAGDGRAEPGASLGPRTPAGAVRHAAATAGVRGPRDAPGSARRSEEHTSELQSRFDLVCRLLLEKKKNTQKRTSTRHHYLKLAAGLLAWWDGVRRADV